MGLTTKWFDSGTPMQNKVLIILIMQIGSLNEISTVIIETLHDIWVNLYSIFKFQSFLQIKRKDICFGTQIFMPLWRSFSRE